MRISVLTKSKFEKKMESEAQRFTPEAQTESIKQASQSMSIAALKLCTLKTVKGVSFAGGYGSETEALKSLRTWICEAKPITATGKK